MVLFSSHWEFSGCEVYRAMLIRGRYHLMEDMGVSFAAHCCDVGSKRLTG